MPAFTHTRCVRVLAFVISTLTAAQAWSAGQAGDALVQLQQKAAVQTSAALQAPMLGATHAGRRLVAVGDYGIVLLSDDDGKSFRQAASVPVSSTLTAVAFANEHEGWAVGQWGVILHTADGGEHWNLQRIATQEDRPLFSVHFINAQEGVAVGLWSLILRTADGGRTWQTLAPPTPPDGGKADRNLFGIFASAKGSLFVAGERGLVLRSDDRGQTWQSLSTGYKGSFWSGAALTDGTLLVAGMRGTIYRSADDGHSWQPVDSGSKSSFTGIVEAGSRVVAVGLDGTQAESADHGGSFRTIQRDDRLSLTAVAVAGESRLVRFSVKGVVPDGDGALR